MFPTHIDKLLTQIHVSGRLRYGKHSPFDCSKDKFQGQMTVPYCFKNSGRWWTGSFEDAQGCL